MDNHGKIAKIIVKFVKKMRNKQKGLTLADLTYFTGLTSSLPQREVARMTRIALKTGISKGIYTKDGEYYKLAPFHNPHVIKRHIARPPPDKRRVRYRTNPRPRHSSPRRRRPKRRPPKPRPRNPDNNWPPIPMGGRSVKEVTRHNASPPPAKRRVQRKTSSSETPRQPRRPKHRPKPRRCPRRPRLSAKEVKRQLRERLKETEEVTREEVQERRERRERISTEERQERRERRKQRQHLDRRERRERRPSGR